MFSQLANHLPACRLVTAAVVALAIGSALPQAGFAATSETAASGVWTVKTMHANPNATVTLTISRAKAGQPAATDKFLAISEGGVYVVTGASASSSRALTPVDFSRMTQTGDAVLVGVQPRSNDPCLFECRAGLPERRLRVTFKIVNKGEQQIRDMIASDEGRK